MTQHNFYWTTYINDLAYQIKLFHRGPEFAAKAFRELLKLLGITSSLTLAYYPQSDGATERVNQEIEAYLLIYCIANPENWSNALTMLKFTHNNRQHAD